MKYDRDEPSLDMIGALLTIVLGLNLNKKQQIKQELKV